MPAFFFGLAVCLSGLSAQSSSSSEAERQFRAVFERAMEHSRQISREKLPHLRVNKGKIALADLEHARGLIPFLDQKKRAQAQFFVGVRRVEIQQLVGTEKRRRMAFQEGLVVRKRAIEQGSYLGYYRVLLMVLLWQCGDPDQFDRILKGAEADPSDQDFLEAEDTKKLIRDEASELYWPLRVLRCDLLMQRDEQAAVDELRAASEALSKERDPELQQWREVCLQRLAWYYIERREYTLAQLFLKEMSPATTRYPRILIASKRKDYEQVVRAGHELAENDPLYAQLVGDAHVELANARRLAGEPWQADFLEAKRLFEAGVLEKRRDPEAQALAHNGLGDAFLIAGEFKQAARHYSLSMAAAEKIRTQSEVARTQIAETRKDIGRLAEQMQRYQEASKQYMSAIAALEAARRRRPWDQLGIGYLEEENQQAVDGIMRLSSQGHVSAVDAIVAIERMKARDLLDWIADPPAVADLEAYRRELQRATLERSRGAGGAAVNLRTIGSDKPRRGEAIADRAALAATLAHLRNPLVLVYWLSSEWKQRKAFLIAGRGGEWRLFELGPYGRAQDLIHDAELAVTSPERQSDADLARAASFFLPKELSVWLSECEQVVVSSHDIVARVPFAALPVAGAALGLQKPIVFAPSLSVLSAVAGREPQTEDALVLDSPVASSKLTDRYRLSPLVHSEREGELVAEAYGGGTKRLRAGDASFRALGKELAKARFEMLHVSGHAVQNPLALSASLLVLSDGAADMGSLAHLDMNGALVVLSNCRSAVTVGDASGGEGVRGLLWGPLAAGARAVVASQWPVDQQATSDFMAQFHYFRTHGYADDAALQEARKRLAAQRNYAHPHYWAGFQLYGIPRTRSGTGLWWLWIVVPILLGVGVFLWSRWR